MSKRTTRGVRRERTRLETAVLAVSILALAFVIGGLVVAGATGVEGPADLRITIGPAEPASGGNVYIVTIENRGGKTAENVVVEITLGDETRELDILSVARGDEEEASIVFPPGSAGSPSARVLSYHETTRG